MKAFVKNSIYCLLLVLSSFGTFAQTDEKKGDQNATPTVEAIEADTQKAQTMTETGKATSQVEMADRLRADGKIYVVVAIILIILVGFIVYLIILDRKIKSLENLISYREKASK
jgi:hypothetical protein